MPESPVSINRVPCENGKKKVIIREREYDALSWPGLKLMGSVVFTVGGIIAAILTAYYTAEASQAERVAQHGQALAAQKQRLDDHEKTLSKTLQQFDATLKEQRVILDDTSKTLIRVDTKQQILIERVERLSNKLDATP